MSPWPGICGDSNRPGENITGRMFPANRLATMLIKQGCNVQLVFRNITNCNNSFQLLYTQLSITEDEVKLSKV